MAAKFFVLFACLALGSAMVVKRDAPSVLADIDKHAGEFQKTMTDSLNQIVNSKDSKDLQKAFKDGSDTVLAQVTTLAAALKDALGDANGKAKEALETTRANLEKTAEDLRKAHPDVEQQVAALKDKLQAAVQNTMQESQKLVKEVSANIEQTNQQLAPKLKAAYDDFVKQAEQVQKNLHEAANKQ